MAALGVSALLASPAKAQVSVNVNIGAQPSWGSTGYSHVDYYYLPEIESYYYVPTRKFIYYRDNRWVHSNYLPSRYRSYNLHQGRKVVINSYRPYLQHNNYRNQYRYANYSPNRMGNRRVVYRDAPGRNYNNGNHEYRGNGRNDNRRFESRGNQGRYEGRSRGGNGGRPQGGHEGGGHGGGHGRH